MEAPSHSSCAGGQLGRHEHYVNTCASPTFGAASPEPVVIRQAQLGRRAGEQAAARADHSGHLLCWPAVKMQNGMQRWPPVANNDMRASQSGPARFVGRRDAGTALTCAAGAASAISRRARVLSQPQRSAQVSSPRRCCGARGRPLRRWTSASQVLIVYLLPVVTPCALRSCAAAGLRARARPEGRPNQRQWLPLIARAPPCRQVQAREKDWRRVFRRHLPRCAPGRARSQPRCSRAAPARRA